MCGSDDGREAEHGNKVEDTCNVFSPRNRVEMRSLLDGL